MVEKPSGACNICNAPAALRAIFLTNLQLTNQVLDENVEIAPPAPFNMFFIFAFISAALGIWPAA